MFTADSFLGCRNPGNTGAGGLSLGFHDPHNLRLRPVRHGGADMYVYGSAVGRQHRAARHAAHDAAHAWGGRPLPRRHERILGAVHSSCMFMSLCLEQACTCVFSRGTQSVA